MAVNEVEKAAEKRRERVPEFPCHGVWAPALTPVDAQLAPDARRFIEHVRWLLDTGCHGVVLFGTTGEAPSFSVEERIAMVDAALDAGLPADRLIVGTGCPALTDTVRLTAHAVRQGCAGALVVPPYYFKAPAEDGVFASYAEIIERTGGDGLRLYLYHFPRLSCVPITPSLVERLVERYAAVIAGIKDSSGDWAGTEEFLRRFPDLAVFPGSEAYLLAALEKGGAGCITATANINAGAIRAAFDAWRSGSERAKALQAEIEATRKAVEAYPLAPALKHLVAHYRAEPGWRRVRPPMVPLAEEAGDRLVAALTGQGFRFAAS